MQAGAPPPSGQEADLGLQLLPGSHQHSRDQTGIAAFFDASKTFAVCMRCGRALACGAGAMSSVIMFFLGELTSPLLNAFTFADAFRHSSKGAFKVYQYLSASFSGTWAAEPGRGSLACRNVNDVSVCAGGGFRWGDPRSGVGREPGQQTRRSWHPKPPLPFALRALPPTS